LEIGFEPKRMMAMIKLQKQKMNRELEVAIVSKSNVVSSIVVDIERSKLCLQNEREREMLID
jgi:hypothetical protein